MTAPDPTRDFFPAAAVPLPVPPYVALVGPLSPTPARTLADVVWEVAA